MALFKSSTSFRVKQKNKTCIENQTLVPNCKFGVAYASSKQIQGLDNNSLSLRIRSQHKEGFQIPFLNVYAL